MSARKKSLVWTDFDVIEEGEKRKARCKLCKAVLVYEGGCTSNLLKHLQAVHKKNINQSETQKTLKDFGITAGRSCNNARKQKLDELICNLITDNNLPFSFVESSSFRELMKYIEPNYSPMCGETAKRIIEQKPIF